MNNYITIDGFEDLKPIQVWQMAWDHINTTKVRSLDEDGDCCYTGKGCAASPFIKTGERRVQGGWFYLRVGGLVPVKHLELVHNIQLCHDDYRPSDGDFLERFNKQMLKIKPE